MEGESRMTTKSGRDSYKDELAKLASDNEQIICIEADLGGKDHPFQLQHPDRFSTWGLLNLLALMSLRGWRKPDMSRFFYLCFLCGTASCRKH